MTRVQAKDKAHLEDLVKQALFEKSIFDLNFIDTSLVTDMSELFQGASSYEFDVSAWDVSQVTDMQGMFQWCTEFNADLSQWDVSKVTDMTDMFEGCEYFDQDLSGWDVGQVTDMSYMFAYCASFDQDLSQWDVSQVTNMSYMFLNCEIFSQDLTQWNVNEVTYFESMFESAERFDPAHIPQAFYQRKNIDPNIDLEQGIKDLIDTLDHTNLELALNFANNIDKLLEARQYIDKALFHSWLFGSLDQSKNEAYKEKAQSIIQSL